MFSVAYFSVSRVSTWIRIAIHKYKRIPSHLTEFMDSQFCVEMASAAATASFNIKHTLSFSFIPPHSLSLHLSDMRLSFPHIRNLTVTQLFVDKCLFALLIMFTFPHILESFLRSTLKFNRTINHHHFHLINFREFKLNTVHSMCVVSVSFALTLGESLQNAHDPIQ